MNGMGNGNSAVFVSCLLQISYAGRTEFGADSANLGLTALLPMESMNTHAWS